MNGDGADTLPGPVRCPFCGRNPELVACDARGEPLDIPAFVASGGSIVPSDTQQREFRIWPLSKVSEWRMVCGCPEPMVSDHRNSLIHRWNARSVEETP